MAKLRTGSICFYHESDFVHMYHERSHKGGKEEITLQILETENKGKNYTIQRAGAYFCNFWCRLSLAYIAQNMRPVLEVDADLQRARNSVGKAWTNSDP